MSIFFGQCNLDLSLLSESSLHKYSYVIKHLPHEKYKIETHRNVGFMHLLQYNTPESVYENQPILDREILFMSVGRIDNREYLASKLDISLNKTIADGKLMQLIYRKYGIDSLHLFRGDWAFAAYNFHQNELCIARCPMGYMSLYYLQKDNQFLFSNALKPLINSMRGNLKLNEKKFVSNYTFWNRSAYKTNTNIEGIFNLEQGNCLKIKSGTITKFRYWQPEKIAINLYLTAEEANKKLNTLFNNAVNSRLRSYKSVASTLSGGLDSSSVSLYAADLLKKQNKRLSTFSHVPYYKSELEKDVYSKYQLDETPLIEATVNLSGNIDANFLDSSDKSLVDGMQKVLDVFDTPVHAACNAYWLFDLFETVKNKGFGTLLMGEGGNGSLSFEGINYFLPITLNRCKKYPFKTLKLLVFKRLIYKYTYSLWKKFSKNELADYVNGLHLNLAINKELGISSSIKNKGFSEGYKSIQDLKLEYIYLFEERSQYGSLIGQYYGIELRDPTVDQDLLEYFLTIPNHLFFDDGFEGRMLVKRLNKLPKEVLYAKKRGLQSADLEFRIKAQAKEIEALVSELKKNQLVKKYFNLSQRFNEKRNIKYKENWIKTLHFAGFLNHYAFKVSELNIQYKKILKHRI